MGQTTITIEKVTEFSDDVAQAIRSLAQQLGNHFSNPSDDDIVAMITSSNTHLFVAKTQEGNIVGMLTLLMHRLIYVKKGFLEEMVVDQNHRGKGIASLLMEAAITYAKENGAKYIDLTSKPDREAGNNLYKKFGFEQRETNMYRLLLSYDER